VIIGILSDTHGRVGAVRCALEALRQRRIEHIFICGDIGGTAVLDCLAGIPVTFVVGNCDVERDALHQHAQRLGMTCLGGGGVVEIDGARIGIAHGHDQSMVQWLVDHERPDYLLLGHTHCSMDCRQGAVRMINPGCVKRSAAVLDTRTGSLEFVRFARHDGKIT